jgi:ABC-type sugar transport system substrate-binding protein
LGQTRGKLSRKEVVVGFLSRLGEFEVLVGVDGLKAGLDAVADGTLTATVFQDAIGQGTQATVVAGKVLAGERVAPLLLFPFKLVTKWNVASFN